MLQDMKAVGLLYGSSSGKTEKIAFKIKECLSQFASVELIDIAETNEIDFNKFSILIFGASTWGIGRLQDDWLTFIVNNPPVDLKGNCVAFFGLGDQDGYPDTFNDGMGILYDIYKPSGFIHLGKWPIADYVFEDSKALEGNEFIGLALDEDNQPDKTDERINSWVSQIIRESNGLNKSKV
jgi:flavodoxin I